MDQNPSPTGPTWNGPADPEPGAGGTAPAPPKAAAPVAAAPAVPGAIPPPPVTMPPALAAVPAAPVTPASRRRGGSMGTIALVLAAVVAIGGIAFAVGRVTAPASASTGRFGNGQFGTGQFANGGAIPSGGLGFAGRGGFGPSIQGTVESIDGSSITVKLANGQTQTIQLDSSTTYNQQTPSSASAVTQGSTVIVRVGFEGQGGQGGQPNASPGASLGPVTARSVTVVQQ